MLTTKSRCWWITPTTPATWPTPGTPATSKPPGTTCRRAARGCWRRLVVSLVGEDASSVFNRTPSGVRGREHFSLIYHVKNDRQTRHLHLLRLCQKRFRTQIVVQKIMWNCQYSQCLLFHQQTKFFVPERRLLLTKTDNLFHSICIFSILHYKSSPFDWFL